MQNYADRLICKSLHISSGGEKNVDTVPISAPRQAGIYVRRSREAQGLTRAQLAEAAGVSERLLASLELGDATGIRLDKLLAVFGALGLSLAAQGEGIAAGSGSSANLTELVRRPFKTRASIPPRQRSSEGAQRQDVLDYRSALKDFIVNDMGVDLAREVG